MPVGDIFVHRGKAAQFFHQPFIPRLRQAVSVVHDITSIATHFIKHHYQTVVFDEWEAAIANGQQPRPLVIDELFVGKILALVKTGRIQVRGTDDRAVAARAEAQVLVHSYVSTPYFLRDIVSNKQRYSELSLSFIFGYSAQQLATAYENNIVAHFASYVKKVVMTTLRRNAMLALGHTAYSQVPVQERRAIDREANWAFLDIMERRQGGDRKCSSRQDFVAWVDAHRGRLMPPADPRYATFDCHVENDPFAFLPFMVRMNHMLEALPSIDAARSPETKLYSPLILRTSYIPTHLQLDTVAMLHLFVDDAEEFKRWYADRFDVVLTHLATKETIAASYGSLVGRKTTKQEEALHATRCWEYVGEIPHAAQNQTRTLKKRGAKNVGSEAGASSAQSKKAKKLEIVSKAKRDPNDYEDKELRFQRMVNTDGYNIGILLTTANDQRGKVYGARKIRSLMPILDPDTCENFRYLLDPKKYKVVACDPGKKELIHLTDGVTTFRHTQARRERECRHKQSSEHRIDMKRKTVFTDLVLPLSDGSILQSPSVEDIETRYLRDFNSKTCNGDRFLAYLTARTQVAHHLSGFYQRAFFRSNKFTVYLGTKSCNDKLVDRIKNAYRGENGQTIVIMWGNWGQRPNALRNGPSTPGIGLRRMVHRRLSNDTRHGITHYGFTATVCEMKTSSVCNACGANVEHAMDPEGREQYRVLKCQNAACKRVWHRDDLGSRNILMQGMHLLQQRAYHPWLTPE